MFTLFSHLRRKPIGLLSLLLQIPLLTLAAPSGHAITVRLAVEEPRLIGALYCMLGRIQLFLTIY